MRTLPPFVWALKAWLFFLYLDSTEQVCVSLNMQEQTRRRENENERASNYMTDLASGSRWLNNMSFADITFRKCFFFLNPHILLVKHVCVYVCVLWATLAPSGLPTLGHASRSSPRRSSGALPGFNYSQIYWTGERFVRVLRGDN